MSIKKGLCVGASTLASLGFYRGCKEYISSESVSDKKVYSFPFHHYVYGSIFGLIGASIYVNPAFLGFVIHDEYLRMSTLDEKKIDKSNMIMNLSSKN